MYRGTPRGGRGRGGKGRGYGVGAKHQANVILIEADESSDKEPKTICSTENVTNLSHSAPDTHSRWILDSGASQHVTGRYSNFSSYTPYLYRHKETIQTADGACHSIKGVGVVQCTPSIKLPSVLYAPSFPVNLISISALTDYMDCRVSLDHENCLIQDRRTWKKLGIGVRCDGMWYLDRSGTSEDVYFALTAIANEEEAKAILLHCRLGHPSFELMSKSFPGEFSKVDKCKLTCDACDYGKHTRISYVSKGLQSVLPFMLIHSDV
jgi:hypothetical protein